MIVLPAATLPMSEVTWFHWSLCSTFESPWPRGFSGLPYWSVAPSVLRCVPSLNARSTETYVLGYAGSRLARSGKTSYDSRVSGRTFSESR
ncbi:hypothetical protein VSR01_34765 [Actinacidiphila sp. DG2A-62]|uniref:hypothetical protein n=1 Tax=Actinacidiphila sp. DG2A-62 TaxID=3108821 RepID=UPI002DBFDF5A|nr:hypothetical protein [Actinacidiphila sp. DG2A-62]MEC3998377.1 hypothetical protein [Actinacidiphila sp. DG2A-62]